MDRDQFLLGIREKFEENCHATLQPFSLERDFSGLIYKDPLANLAFSFFSTGYQLRQDEIEKSSFG